VATGQGFPYGAKCRNQRGSKKPLVPCSFLPDLMAEDITQVSTRSGEAAERRMPKSGEISTEIMEILQQQLTCCTTVNKGNCAFSNVLPVLPAINMQADIKLGSDYEKTGFVSTCTVVSVLFLTGIQLR